MSELAPPLAPKSSRLLSLWMTTMMALGGIGGGYLIALWVAPDLVSRHLPLVRADEDQAEKSEALAQQVTTLKDSVGQVQLDVAKLKVEVTEQDERGKHFADRLNVLESRPATPVDPSRADAPAGGQAVPFSLISGPEKVQAEAGAPLEAPANAPEEPAQRSMQEIVVTSPEPAAGRAIETKSSARAGGLETGSVGKAAAPVSFGAPVVKPAAPKIAGIQLGTGTSVDEIRLSWLALSDRHGGALKNLQPRYVVGRNGSGPTYSLLAGPLKSPADAKRVCAALEGDGVPCSVGSFNGNAL